MTISMSILNNRIRNMTNKKTIWCFKHRECFFHFFQFVCLHLHHPLIEKRWYICSDVNYRTHLVHLYSLPFAFQHFIVSTYSFNMSLTNLFNHKDKNTIDTCMYKNVKTLSLQRTACKFLSSQLMLNIPQVRMLSNKIQRLNLDHNRKDKESMKEFISFLSSVFSSNANWKKYVYRDGLL